MYFVSSFELLGTTIVYDRQVLLDMRSSGTKPPKDFPDIPEVTLLTGGWKPPIPPKPIMKLPVDFGSTKVDLDKGN